jgi:hypothetical protein
VLLDVVNVGVVDLLTEILLGLRRVDLVVGLQNHNHHIILNVLNDIITNRLELLPAGVGSGEGSKGKDGKNAVHDG